MSYNYKKKRQFVQLAETYTTDKHINGWYVSEKLDGQRCFWDGGLTRNIPAEEVPFANTEKDHIRIERPVATGLWSRLGKVIYAPDWWLDRLPNIPLDGELFIGPGQFQKLQSIVRARAGLGWEEVKYYVFDSPPFDEIFSDGQIEVRVGDQKYSRELRGVDQWIKKIRGNQENKIKTVNGNVDFGQVLRFLKSEEIENEVVKVLEQVKLPVKTSDIEEALEKEFIRVLDSGMEGLIIRANYERWRPIRAGYVLKYKPFNDDEGTVVGYVWGKGKHEGRMGSLIVDWQGREFKLSGFTDKERVIEGDCISYPGELIKDECTNPMFPRGTIVTFRYRELSDGRIPREGRFLRKKDLE